MRTADLRRRWWSGFLLLAVILCLDGCTQILGGKAEIRQKRRFTMVAEPIRFTMKHSGRPYPATVHLQALDIAGHYNQIEIVNRSSPYELRRDALHVWGLRPREMLTQVVAEYLRGSQLFARLVTDRDLLDGRPDYVLSGSVRAVERFDSGDRWFARLLLSLQLVRQSDGKVVWRGQITDADDLEVYDADMQYTVQALSEILRRRMEVFVRQLDRLFLRMSTGQLPADASFAATDSLLEEAVSSAPDTHAVAVPDYYELIPGKLAP